jgi:hypothetical protein
MSLIELEGRKWSLKEKLVKKRLTEVTMTSQQSLQNQRNNQRKWWSQHNQRL